MVTQIACQLSKPAQVSHRVAQLSKDLRYDHNEKIKNPIDTNGFASPTMEKIMADLWMSFGDRFAISSLIWQLEDNLEFM